MNDFSNHPGFIASACPARITVTPASYSTASHSYSCKVTGGHCLPDASRCSGLIDIFKIHQAKTFNMLSDKIDDIDNEYYDHPQGQS